MLKDITIGQYFPGHSSLHRLDPRVKIVLTVVYIILLFLVKNSAGFAVSILFLVVCYMAAKIPVKMILRSLKPIVPILIFTGALNILFVSGEHVIFDWGIFHITQEGIYTAVTMAIRVLCLIAGSSLLTYTTSPIALTDAIERLLGPLKALHFPVHELAMMMSIALRFIPTLIEETDKIMSAQKARGADLESGGLMQRARALVPILIPLFISAFRRAEELALAMECRCYHGGKGRTRMKQLHLGAVDGAACGIMVLTVGAVIALNLLPIPW
ncbi:MAG: energy-coupling factor transporter transmembrane component T family protein [Candidatus Merdivicinus sp.]|jgi:energy-coupling factor transport system permease protein